ncbi:glycosyltransferase family 2 protein [Motiliproteus sediminis]|uniref:glycosyltransferase family 2 protein n=1 Tax=Motiliproteus sediminis TaxID=1468178 RepID=UPI001AEF94AB|nr:glycosyltransferase [Motiliproteus sediminis]
MRKITLLATFWNELEWIEASLDQMHKLNADEIIICDGCFDENKYNGSEDGTSEVLRKFAEENSNVRIIRAFRIGRLKYFIDSILINFFSLSHVARTLIDAVTKSNYRLNQAYTFNKMLSMAKHNQPGDWFMTIDADQFYNDRMIELISNRENWKLSPSCHLITAKELTFFEDFNHYIQGHEKRTWNNMPHRIVENGSFYPTRHYKVPVNGKLKFLVDVFDTEDVGYYFHYKFRRNVERLAMGYELGDRKNPEVYPDLSINVFTGDHPASVSKKVSE